MSVDTLSPPPLMMSPPDMVELAEAFEVKTPVLLILKSVELTPAEVVEPTAKSVVVAVVDAAWTEK